MSTRKPKKYIMDKFALYEQSVQDPESDIDFIGRTFKKKKFRTPLAMREDFCGTAKLCAAWAHSHEKRTAVGLDLHKKTLAYGHKHHIASLPLDEQNRVRLLARDVLVGTKELFDCIVAYNFSYCVFNSRLLLKQYFSQVHKNLRAHGAFFIDLQGGEETQKTMQESTRHGHFTYIWDQRDMDAVTARAKRYIHFRLKDGAKIERAFTYDWRVWTLPEIRDLLDDVGFKQVDVYWEWSDKKGAGSGIYRRVEHAKNNLSWVAVLVAWR